MTSAGRGRWRLIISCLVAAVAWQYVYSTYRVDAYFAGHPPQWLRSIHFWMPDTLSVRLLNVFGFRFYIGHYGANTGFTVASMAIEAIIWAMLFCVVVVGLARLRRGDRQAAAA